MSIKRFLLGVLVATGLLLAYYAYAQSNNHVITGDGKTVYFDDKENTLIKPACDPILASTQAADDCFYREPKRTYKKTGLGFYRGLPVQCFCAEWLKRTYGYQYIGTIVYAKNWPTNSSVPSVGSVVVFTDSGAGHVGKVLEIVGTKMRLHETNYESCKETTDRWVDMSDQNIKGYWDPNKNV